MAVAPNTLIRLLKIPFLMDNKNQLTFSNLEAQTNYFLGRDYVEVDETEYTYQRKDNIIRFPAHLDDIIDYNYVMYKNNNYSDKWFYAFITNMTYENDGLTNISIETDVFQTWQFDIQYKKCFVEREHVNDDTVGLHTVPENLETGEYICNEHYKDQTMDNYASDLCYVMASTSEPIAGEAKDTVAGSKKYNGIYTGLTYYEYETSGAIDILLEVFAEYAKTQAINGIFMAPKWLAPLKQGGLYREVAESSVPNNFNINVPKQNTLNGYSPKNNKLKCFPFNYLLVSNNIGQNSIMHYEKFSNNQNATFNVKGVLNPRVFY